MSEWETAVCKDCQQEFAYYPRYSGKRVRCWDCSARNRREKLAEAPASAVCQQCKKPFEYLAWFGTDHPPKFCGEACRKAYQASYMREYRKRVKVARKCKCLVCGQRKILRWSEYGLDADEEGSLRDAGWQNPRGRKPVADGTMCSPACFVSYWKEKLLTGQAWDFSPRILGLLKVRAEARTDPELSWVLELTDNEAEDLAWSHDSEFEDEDWEDLPVSQELDDQAQKARVTRLVQLKRSDGTL